MATAPYGVRLLVGAAVTALEETRKLPQTILMYPMTVVSQVAQLVMKMQQDVADLVNKGDETLEQLFPPKDEQAEWATFDEDSTTTTLDDADDAGARLDGERLTEGRFALYTTGEPETRWPNRAPAADGAVGRPAIVAELDYESLTLAQLRARLPSLRVADLEALLAYEECDEVARPVPDAAGQQDHPRDRQVTDSRARAGQVPREPLAGACGRERVAKLDRPARHGVGRGPDDPAQRPRRIRRRSWCCAIPPPTCRCR